MASLGEKIVDSAHVTSQKRYLDSVLAPVLSKQSIGYDYTTNNKGELILTLSISALQYRSVKVTDPDDGKSYNLWEPVAISLKQLFSREISGRALRWT